MRYAMPTGSHGGARLNSGRPRTCEELKNRGITISMDPWTIELMDEIAQDHFQGNRSKYILNLVTADMLLREKENLT